MRRVVDHYVHTNELTPPLGRHLFVAKIRVAFGDENIRHEELPFEAFGATEEEAVLEAERKFREWLNERIEE